MEKNEEQIIIEKMAKDLEFIKNFINSTVWKTYSTEEAAKIIGVSKKTLCGYRKNEKIEYSQIGSVVRFTMDDLNDFINKYKRHARP